MFLQFLKVKRIEDQEDYLLDRELIKKILKTARKDRRVRNNKNIKI